MRIPMPPLLAIAVPVLLLLAPAVVQGGQATDDDAVAQQEQAFSVTDRASGLELKFPGAWWEVSTRMDLAKRGGGGCAAPQVPDNVLLLCQHQDAPLQLACIRGTDPFLMRNREDLEKFVAAVNEAMARQVGETMQVVEDEYDERDGMFLHRFLFTVVPSGGGGGCAPRPQQGDQPEKVSCLYVDYFLRPADSDARNFRIICYAPTPAFEEFRPEIDYITSNLTYTGELAQDFFVADAPQEKVPTAEQAEESVQQRRGGSSMWFIVGLMVLIWFMFRRKKKAQA